MSHNQLRSSTSIDGNSANGSAIQNIFYINMKVNNDLGHIPDGIRYLVKYFMRGLENRPHGMTNPLTKQKALNFFASLGDNLPSQIDNDTDVDLSNGIQQQQLRREKDPTYHFLHNECFPNLEWLNYHDQGQFPDINDTPWVAYSLNQQQRDYLTDWLVLNVAQTLIVFGQHDVCDGLPQVTSLVLEMAKVLGVGLSQVDSDSSGKIGIIAHFFGESIKAKDWGKEAIVIQNLLAQLLHTHQHKFTNSETCQQGNLTKQKLSAIKNNTSSLWETFKWCVNHTGIHTLIVMFDRVNLDCIDSVYVSLGTVCDPPFLNKLISKLQTELGEAKVTVKVMVTTQLTEVAKYYDSTNAKILDLHDNACQAPTYDDF